jgi:hypothetical protein
MELLRQKINGSFIGVTSLESSLQRFFKYRLIVTFKSSIVEVS